MNNEKKKIIILGAGFGGVYAYLSLHKELHGREDVEIILIDKKNYFLFVPMIHEVATGNLEASSIIQPLRHITKCCVSDVIEGTVDAINLDSNTVKVTTNNNQERTIQFDYLISALGSQNNFFGTPGADEYTYPLKDLHDAVAIRKGVLNAFEQASQAESEEEQHRLLTFVVVGGGPTGVELAGELADLIGHEMQRAYPALHPKCTLHLVHAGKRLMEPVDEWFAEKSTDILTGACVNIHLDTCVERVEKDTTLLSDGNMIHSNIVFWTAGVKAQTVAFTGESAQHIVLDERSGRITVEPALNIRGLEHVFVVGDQMYLGDKETGQPYPMRAQFAAREGSVAGENVVRIMHNAPLQEFSWNDQGFIVSLGKGGALAQIFGIKFSGAFAWWIYRTAYLFKLVGVRAKLKTAFEWTLNLFLPRNISKL